MSNPTSNFNWQMPTATDLVTDLPADFEVFGQAVDSSMADLLGGTTGQILAKNSNTNMDFVWITNDVGDITEVAAGTGISGGGTSGAVTITNSMATEITAKADLIVGTGNAAFDNLPVGANGTVLTADSSVSPTGLKWATPASGLSWTSFTPSWGAFTVGNGTVVGKYATLGSSCFVTISVVLGSTSSVSGGMYFTPPVLQSGTGDRLVGQIMFQKSGGNAKFGVIRTLKAFDRMYLSPPEVSGSYQNVDTQTSSTAPFTWANGDSFLIQGYWETV